MLRDEEMTIGRSKPGYSAREEMRLLVVAFLKHETEVSNFSTE
jgi:hypothetical protein